MKLAVITAVFGGYDAIPPVPIGFDDAVLVSDRPIESDWRNVVIEHELSPRLTSKIPKFRPDMFTSLEYSVWVDASMRDPENWLATAAKVALKKSELILFRHPQRNTISSEIIASREASKYDEFPLEEQLRSYLDEGFTDTSGLWAGGVIARRHTNSNKELGTEWFTENIRWSIQDQISFPYVAWKLGLAVDSFEEHQYEGPLRWIHHFGELPQINRNITRFEAPTTQQILLGQALILAKQGKIWLLLRATFNITFTYMTTRASNCMSRLSKTIRGLRKYLVTFYILLKGRRFKEIFLGLANVARQIHWLNKK